MKKYSFINPDPTLQNNLMAFGFECDEGWWPLIIECFDKIQFLLDEKYPKLKKTFLIVQVKEKFGGLRIYCNYDNDEIDSLIDEACEKAEQTCEVCGQPGKMQSKYHWMKTICDKDFEEWK